MRPGVERRQIIDTVDRDDVDYLDEPAPPVCYYIIAGNDDNNFEIEPISHQITVSLKENIRCQHTSTFFTSGYWFPKLKFNMHCITALYQLKSNELMNLFLLKHIKILVGANFFCCQTIRELDREEKEIHTLLVKASEDCTKAPPKFSNATLSENAVRDDTILKLLIWVVDTNDNAPHFVKRVFTGGVSTEAEFGTEALQVKVRLRCYDSNRILLYFPLSQ